MDYRNEQASPSKHLTGISVVAGVHLVMAWLVVSGVGITDIDVVPTKPVVLLPVIDAQIKPPKPKQIEPLAPPTVVVTQITPPEIEIEQPRGSVPTIISVPLGLQSTGEKSVGNTGDAGEKVGAAAVRVAASASVGVACPNSNAVRENVRYPAQAQRDGLQGEVEVEFTVSAAGVISGESIVSSTNRAFNSASLLATRQFKCVGQGQDVKVKVPYSFKLAN